MKKPLLLTLLVGVIGFIVWGAMTFIETYEREVTTGYSNKAIQNPFLAAQLFLERNGVEVIEETDVLDFSLIDTNETVFLSDVDDMILTQSQITKALSWVERGGFLIVGVGAEIEGNASILERFDIDPIEYTEDLDDSFSERDTRSASQRLRDLNDDVDERAKNGESTDDNASLEELLKRGLDEDETYYTVNLSDDDGQLRLQVVDRIVLNHPLLDNDGASEPIYGDYHDSYELSAQVSDERGARALQLDYGEGTFTALSSSLIWNNELIDEADHAYFLAYFMSGESSIRFFYNVVAPSLFELLKHYFFELIVTILALLALWIWRLSIRVQGVKHEVTNQRRAFSEHLQASAEFLVAKEQYSLLLAPIHAEIEAQMRQLHPLFSEQGQDKQISLISTQTQIATESVRAWFDALTEVKNQETMIAVIKIGNAIRNEI